MQAAHYAFMFLGFTISLFNARVFWALRRRLLVAFPRRGRALVWLCGVFCFVMLSPTLALTFGGLSALRAFRDLSPIWFAIAYMALQFGFWVYGASLALLSAPLELAMRWRQLKRMLSRDPQPLEDKPENPERRRALTRASLTLPAAIVATAGAGAVASQDVPRLGRLTLRARREFSELDGLKIAQFSDVHIGSYMSNERLEMLRERLLALKPDIIVCTGDLIDNELGQLTQATALLRGLAAPLGVYMCMGNHEYISALSSPNADVSRVIKPLRETGTNLLVNESRKIRVGSSHLWLMGLDYPEMRGLPPLLQSTTTRSFDACLSAVNDDGAPRIVLAHNPAQFREGQKRPIDLMLSGHTHGGQVSLGRVGRYEFTPVLPFEVYHRGEYLHEGRKLYVNSGYGGWLPVRINCPPEITLVTLQT